MYSPTSAAETIILLKLALKNTPLPVTATKPRMNPAQRRNLENLGFLTVSKVGRKLYYHPIDEALWRWVSSTPPTSLLPLLRRSRYSADLAIQLLDRLHKYCAENKILLAEVVSDTTEKESCDTYATYPTPKKESCETLSLVFQYCKSLGKKSPSGKIKIADLHGELIELKPSDITQSLVGLQQQGKIVLFPIQTESEITSLDKQFQIEIGVGQPRHVIYIQN